MTTQCLLFEWLESYERTRVKQRTYRRYHSIIEHHIVPTFGNVEIASLCRRQIHEFLTEQKKFGNLRSGEQLSGTSINLILTVLNAAFEYACMMEWVEGNPCSRIKRAPEDGKKGEAFTKDEQRKLEQAIMEQGDRRLFGILLCLYSGLRLGELIALEWNDVDLESGIIAINKIVYREKNDSDQWQLCIDTPKTKSSARKIPLPSYIAEQLREYRKLAMSPYVIENKRGERISIRSYQYIFEKLTERAGVRKLNFHALRHTFATRAIECGMDVKTLSEIMGHKNASVTLNRYAHSMMETKIEMMNKLYPIFNKNCTE